MHKREPDFHGWATKNDILCTDGRIIRKNAFIDDNGKSVPLVWNHQHNSPDNILGHAILENQPEGVRVHGYLNDTESGITAKVLVQSEDIDSLSIFANQLRQNGPDVVHGAIREVSLVLAGANSGASIDTVIQHGEDSGDSVVICTGESLYHSEDGEPLEDMKQEKQTEKEPEKKAEKTEKEPEKKAEKTEKEPEKKTEKEPDGATETSGETILDILKAMSEKQKNVVYEMVAKAMETKTSEKEPATATHSAIINGDEFEGGTSMKRNFFDKEGKNMSDTLTHDALVEIINEGKKGSMKDAFLAHGIENIDYLFPDAKTVNSTPGLITRDMTWVSDIMANVHHTPFSRIKSVFANITENDARARGYIKGNKKVDEVFALLKRVTTPCTVYKHQSIDRDDVVDITDFDVIAWLKSEMRMMLDEELARAFLVGDGRNASSDDKINEGNIRPIWTDDDLYTIKRTISVSATMTDDDKAKALERIAVKARKDYKGSGNCTFYTTEDNLTNSLLREDNQGRRIYKSIDELSAALRVTKIVIVPVMENLTRTDATDSKVHTLMGIIVNLRDYNVGADKGGAVNMFDDFDIDYNKQKYLIETRCSAALTVPYSAIVIESVPAA